MAKFSVPLDKLAAKANEKLETVVRKATFDLFAAIVRRSPVGNPELWKANESAGVGKTARTAYLAEAEAYNIANPGKRRMGTGRKTVEKKFPLVAGKGYVGGRFRANWNVSYGAIDITTTDSTNKARGMREAEKTLTLPVGGVVYLSNGLPYAHRLEYGWSRHQAPEGMVRISVAEFDRHIRKSAAEK